MEVEGGGGEVGGILIYEIKRRFLDPAVGLRLLFLAIRAMVLKSANVVRRFGARVWWVPVRLVCEPGSIGFLLKGQNVLLVQANCRVSKRCGVIFRTFGCSCACCCCRCCSCSCFCRCCRFVVVVVVECVCFIIPESARPVGINRVCCRSAPPCSALFAWHRLNLSRRRSPSGRACTTFPSRETRRRSCLASCGKSSTTFGSRLS